MAQSITNMVAVLSICTLSLALQPLQCALRAIVIDLCPREQQVQAQGWSVRFSSFGQILGCTAGIVYRPSTDPLGAVSTFRILSGMAVMAVSTTTAWTLLTVRERSGLAIRGPRSDGFRFVFIMKTLLRTYSESSTLVRQILGIQMLAWIGWFMFLFYNTR